MLNSSIRSALFTLDILKNMFQWWSSKNTISILLYCHQTVRAALIARFSIYKILAMLKFIFRIFSHTHLSFFGARSHQMCIEKIAQVDKGNAQKYKVKESFKQV